MSHVPMIALLTSVMIAAGAQEPIRRQRAPTPCLTWTTVSSRIFWHGAPALSKIHLAPIWASITDGQGKPTGKGGYLTVQNHSRTDTVFITSEATGDHNMPVEPEETYRSFVAAYKRPGEQTTADLEVKYCSRR